MVVNLPPIKEDHDDQRGDDLQILRQLEVEVEERTQNQRTEHIVTNVEMSEAMATFIVEYEQEEQRAMDKFFLDDVTHWPDVLPQPSDDTHHQAVLETSQQYLATDLTPQ